MAAIRKRTRRHKDGAKNVTWQVDFYDQGGRRHMHSFATRAAAESYRATVHTKTERGTYQDPKGLPTFGELAIEWLTNKAPSLRPSTLAQFENHVYRHLEPTFGRLRIGQISVEAIERFRNELAVNLSAQTVNKVLTTMTAILRLAVKRKKLEWNPAALADRLRAGSQEIKSEPDAPQARQLREVLPDEILAPGEVAKLIGHAEAGFYRTLLQVAAMTGARINEILALQWSDVNLQEGKLHVRRSLTWAKTKAEKETTANPLPRFYPPKTKASIRTLPLVAELVAALREWKLACPIGDEDLVFPTPFGRPKYYSTVHHEGFAPALTEAKLRSVTFHSLRHTFASALIQEGKPPTEVAHLLGHSSSAVTMKIYAHWFKSSETTSLDALAKRILPGTAAA